MNLDDKEMEIMNNFALKFKMFLKNKNTVTILCALLAIGVLIVGYNWRIKDAVNPVKVPYALKTIQPRTTRICCKC